MSPADPRLRAMLRLAPVIPVYTPGSVDEAVAVAQALLDGGLPVIEVTLRTPVALDCIRRIAGEVEGAVVGAGTVITASARQAVADAGAKFAVSPGLIEGEGVDGPTPLLPGVATATELMRGLRAGFTHFTLFPANVVGGVGALKAFSSPFPQATFCPTGGVDVKNAPDYLALPNVICVGGSWVAPADAIRAGEWDRITDLARAASQLGKAA